MDIRSAPGQRGTSARCRGSAAHVRRGRLGNRRPLGRCLRRHDRLRSRRRSSSAQSWVSRSCTRWPSSIAYDVKAWPPGCSRTRWRTSHKLVTRPARRGSPLATCHPKACLPEQALSPSLRPSLTTPASRTIERRRPSTCLTSILSSRRPSRSTTEALCSGCSASVLQHRQRPGVGDRRRCHDPGVGASRGDTREILVRPRTQGHPPDAEFRFVPR